MGNLKRALRL